ncbi:MAG: DUF58 domain-containing protein [Gemmataceae bacterium]
MSPTKTAQDYLRQGEQQALRYLLGAPRAAPVGQAGTTLSQRAGSSLEFKDHRGYEPGDDLRHIDWSVYARSDVLTVKVYREEITPHLDVLVDTSRSMNLEGTPKAGATLALAAFFAVAATRGGYTVTPWLLGGDCRPLPAGQRPPTQWEPITFSHRGDVTVQLPTFRARSTRVLVSDLFWLGDPLRFLRPFAEQAAMAVVVQMLARADVEPLEGQSLRLVDSETDEVKEIHIDAIAAQRYRDNLARHQQYWHNACKQVGAVFLPVVAEKLLNDWNMDAFVAAEVLRIR